MTIQIPPGFMAVIQPFRYTAIAGKDYSITYGIQPVTPQSAQSALDEVDQTFRDNLLAPMDNQYNWQPAVGYFRDPGGALILLQSSVAAQSGSFSGNTASPNVAMVVKKRTAQVGRKFRGRFFMHSGYVPEGDVDERGGLTTTLVTNRQNNFNQLLVDVAGDGFYVGLWLLHSSLSDPPTQITSFVVDATVATQRRRLER